MVENLICFYFPFGGKFSLAPRETFDVDDMWLSPFLFSVIFFHVEKFSCVYMESSLLIRLKGGEEE